MADELITELTSHFTGREWLFGSLEEWLQNSSSRSMLITGEPGSGKSAVAAQLVRLSIQQAVSQEAASRLIDSLSAFHFCRARDDASLSPLRFVKSLSQQLASRHPEFAPAVASESDAEPSVIIDAHQHVGVVGPNSIAQNVVIGNLELGALTSARQAFDRLVRRPLERLYRSGQLERPIVVLVDSLDEALTFDSDLENTIVGVLRHWRPLPKNVFFLLTSRRSERIDSTLAQSSIDLISDAPDDIGDVERYSLARLKSFPKDRALNLAKLIAQASQGNFLYVKFVIDDLERLTVLPADISEVELPRGLEEVFERFLERDLVTDVNKWQREYRPLLGFLVVARGRGLSREQLLGVAHLAPSQLDDALAACLPYIRGNAPNGPFQLYHSSFREYLITSSRYSVYPAQANLALAKWLYETNRGRWSEVGDDYAIRHAIRHLTEAIQKQSNLQEHAYLLSALAGLATDLDYLKAKVQTIGVDDLMVDLDDTVDTLPASYPGLHDVIAVARVIQRERHNLRLAVDLEVPLALRPSVLLQVQYRATSLGLHELAVRAQQAEDPKHAAKFRVIAVSGAEDPALIRVLAGHSDVVMGVTASADGRTAFSGDQTGVIKLWDISTGRSLWTSKLCPDEDMEGLLALTMSKDGLLGLAGYHNGSVAVWNLAAREGVHELRERKSPVFALAVDAAGTCALAGFEDGTVVRWNLETWETANIIQGATPITALCLNAGGDRAIIGDRNGTVTAFNFIDRRPQFQHRLHGQQVQSLAFSEDENSVISCGQDGAVLIFSPRTGLISAELPREGQEYLYRALIARRGALAITSAHDNSVRLWDLEARRLVYRFKGHSGGVAGLDLCGASQAISCGADQNIILWDLGLANKLYRDGSSVPARGTPGHDTCVPSVSIASDASIAASGSLDGKIVLWRIDTGGYFDTYYTSLPGAALSVSLSSNGERLLALCHGRHNAVAIVWDVVQKRRISQFGHLHLTGRAGAMSADGSLALAATNEATLCLWDTTTGEVRATLRGHEGLVVSHIEVDG